VYPVFDAASRYRPATRPSKLNPPCGSVVALTVRWGEASIGVSVTVASAMALANVERTRPERRAAPDPGACAATSGTAIAQASSPATSDSGTDMVG
jgi:hypothetical protein